MLPGYVFYSTSGNSSGLTHHATMSTAIPLPSPSSVLPSWVTTESHQKLIWKLTTSGLAPVPAQVSWFRSIYPDESALQSCSPTVTIEPIQLPPGVAIMATLVKATAADFTPLKNTLETFGEMSETTATATVAAIHVEYTLQHHPGATMTSTNLQSTGSPIALESTEDDNFPASSVSTIATDEPGRGSQTAHIIIGTDVVTADSHTHFKIGSKTLAPAGTPVVISSTTYSLLSAGTAIVVNGQTLAVDQTVPSKSESGVSFGSTPLQPAPKFSVTTLSGGKVMVNGHTLAMNTTLTLGSGSGTYTTGQKGNSNHMGAKLSFT